MDVLKPLEEITAADERWGFFVHLDSAELAFRPVELADRYAEISAINLVETVPENIREHFETAKNLLLYAWFVYRFIPVAELHAYSTVEMALRGRASQASLKTKNFKALLKLAIDRGWIVDDGFSIVQRERKAMEEEREWRRQFGWQITPEEQDSQRYCKILLDAMPFLRNNLAHGSTTVHPGGIGTLALCADMINQLFNVQ